MDGMELCFGWDAAGKRAAPAQPAQHHTEHSTARTWVHSAQNDGGRRETGDGRYFVVSMKKQYCRKLP